MSIKEHLRKWILKEGFQSYGVILLGMTLAGGFGEPEFGMALLQGLTGSDFTATSFAFLFASLFATSARKNDEVFITIVICLVMCIVFYIVVKIFPLNIPAEYNGFSSIKPKNRIIWYSLFSVASVFATLTVISKLRVSSEAQNAVA